MPILFAIYTLSRRYSCFPALQFADLSSSISTESPIVNPEASLLVLVAWPPAINLHSPN